MIISVSSVNTTSIFISDLTVLSPPQTGDLAWLGEGDGVQMRDDGKDRLSLDTADGDRSFGVAG